MSNKGYLLPETINPAGRRYVCVPVPDDPQHLMAFIAQLDMLAYWWTWKRDDQKQATQVARVWREIVETVRYELDNGIECEMPFDIRLTDECELQKSIDGGQNWITVADIADCAGEDGTDGRSPEIRMIDVNATRQAVQWRYTDEDDNAWRTVGYVDDGAQGAQGIQGVPGETGATGATGAKGDKGDKGDTGEKGEKGDKGDTGEKGDTGGAVESPPPEVDEDAKVCGIAVELMDWFIALDADVAQQVSNVQTAAAAVRNIADLVYPVGLIVSAISTAVQTYFDVGIAAIQNGQTVAVKEDLRDRLYCHLLATGVTVATFENWTAEVLAAYPLNLGAQEYTNVWTWYDFSVIERRAWIGSTEPSEACAECEDDATWCYLWNFTEGNGGWNILESKGSYTAGYGWDGTYINANSVSGVYIKKDIPAGTVITKVVVSFQKFGGSGANNQTNVYTLDDGVLEVVSADGRSSGVYEFDTVITGSPEEIRISCNTGTANESLARILSVQFEGTGENPFGDDNC